MTVDPVLHDVSVAFVDEARELVQQVSLGLLALDHDHARAAAFERVARGLHTLKGSAATLGLQVLAELSHRMEDAIGPWRGASTAPPAPVVDALLGALDGFMLRLTAEVAGRDPPSLDESAAAIAIAVAAAAEDLTGGAPHAPVVTGAGGVRRDLAGDASTLMHLETTPDDEAARELSDEGSWRVRSDHVVGLMAEVDRLRVLRLRLDERRRELSRAIDELAALRVTRETVEVRLRLANMARRLSFDGEEAAAVVSSFDEELKAISTLPVRAVLDPLHRAVRNICRQSGKQAQLSVVGAELSLDRRVLQALRAPLVHLVTNAVDHGIEPPAAREERGKDPTGCIVIRVEQGGNLLTVSVGDDGGGLDSKAIREQAVWRGLLSREEAEQLAPEDLHGLIFHPGFSTLETVSARSGRGVGLDVVRTQVQSLRGQIAIETRPGQGTTFRLTLPIELGSSPLLVVRTGEHRVGVPMVSVEAVGAARKEQLRVGVRRMHLEAQEQLLPAYDLGAVLRAREPQVPPCGRPYLVVRSHGARAAFFVDEVIGHYDLSVRPLPQELRSIPAYDGAATLAGGEPLLTLRPEWLVRYDASGGDEAPIGGTRRALVVDGSLTARALQRATLEAGGFVVHVVSDARGALEHLRHAAYEVLVCDVRLEGVSGLELTRALRASPDLQRLPVVLVSAGDHGEDARRRALESGADAFLSKRECAAGGLLRVVAAAIERARAGPAPVSGGASSAAELLLGRASIGRRLM